MKGERQTRFLMEGFEVVMVPDINVRDTLVRDVVNDFRALQNKTRQRWTGNLRSLEWNALFCSS